MERAIQEHQAASVAGSWQSRLFQQSELLTLDAKTCVACFRQSVDRLEQLSKAGSWMKRGHGLAMVVCGSTNRASKGSDKVKLRATHDCLHPDDDRQVQWDCCFDISFRARSHNNDYASPW